MRKKYYNNIRVIAFYLPQYHPTVNNDKWWGKDFTEWTNVRKAKSLYRGHYQPKVPTELGYYDLRKPEVREAQAKLAHEAGIEGFCYYHYRFEDGKRELEMPFNEVLKLGEPDFPFCLCWANESWSAKFWKKDGTSDNKLLVEQKYLGEEDNTKYFYELLPAFKDERYIKIEGKPLFMIYKPLQFSEVKDLVSLWQKLAIKNGLEGIYFVGQTVRTTEIGLILSNNFDAVNLVRLYDVHQSQGFFSKILRNVKGRFFHKPFIYSYKKASKRFIGKEELAPNVFPTLIPNWDHTPRSNTGGFVLDGSTPELFKCHVDQTLKVVNTKDDAQKIVFLKSWNEWGEGNYMEPDEKFGKSYIEVLYNSLKNNH